jgi:hypothetical protein
MRKLLTAGVILGVTAMQLAALPARIRGLSLPTLILLSSFLIKACAWRGVFTFPSRLPRIKKLVA